MPTAAEVEAKLDKIEQEHFQDKKTYGYLLAVGYETDDQRPRIELSSNLTRAGLLKLAELLIDKAETM